jgi:hypothetical protein
MSFKHKGRSNTKRLADIIAAYPGVASRFARAPAQRRFQLDV